MDEGDRRTVLAHVNLAMGIISMVEDAGRWWRSLTLDRAVEVAKRHATNKELERIQSRRAARTWWNSLSVPRRCKIYQAETGNP